MKTNQKKLWTIFNEPFLEFLKIKKKNASDLESQSIPIPLRYFDVPLLGEVNSKCFRNHGGSPRLVSSPTSDKLKCNSFFLIKFLFVLFLTSGFSVMRSNAQILKKLEKKIGTKLEQRADSKMDKTIDKTLDATEVEVDKSLKASQEKKENEANANTSANNSITAAEANSQVPTTANLADALVMVEETAPILSGLNKDQ